MAIPQPRNQQLQSRLISLPTELKHLIFGYCFVAEKPIVDPVVGSPRAEAESISELGSSLLQICRRVYYETDRRPLYSRNRFRFMTIETMHSFLDFLAFEFRASIRDVEIDARRVHADYPGIGREWLHYLAYGGGTWSKTLGSLRSKAPGLKCVRLNVELWPDIPMFRIELWSLLRSMLLQLDGLGRIVVIGAKDTVGWYKQEPWSSVHFVGGANVESNDLVQRMGRTVAGRDSEKLIRWDRENGRHELEVISRSYHIKEIDKPWVEVCSGAGITDPWPGYGFCTWSAYQTRTTGPPEPPAKKFNSSDVG
jgi:hypothetical protein